MKNLFKLTAVIVALCAALTAHAEGKIAVLNVQQAVINTEAAQARLKKLQSEPDFAANVKQAKQLTKDYKKLVAQLQKDAAVMSAEQKQTEANKVQEKRSDIEHVQRKIQAAEQQLMQELMGEMGPKLKTVVDDLIKKKGIGLLLNQQATMYVDSSYSITAEVTDNLNKMK